MSNSSERRAADATRIPFDGMVEVGGSLGPSFEAQAVNLSEEGMHLRTAYLPEIGQPVTCRFDAGQGMVVTAAGEVLWRDDRGDGGEFGIRFTNLDSASTVALQRIVGMVEDGHAIRPPTGRKVRLHIDGLASPMRARVRGAHGTSVTAFSELGFLQVGKQLDLEDAATGTKRPALIDRVAVDVEPETRIPQLVVTLRYDDEEAHAADMNGHYEVEHEEMAAGHGSLSPHAMDGDMDDDIVHDGRHDDDHMPHDDHAPIATAKAALEGETTEEEEPKDMKGALARGAAKVTPALEKWFKRTKTTMALLAARARAKSGVKGDDDVEIPVRRTTAPAPGGGLTTSGRKVIRGEIEEAPFEDEAPKPRFVLTKKKMLVGGAIGVTAILAMVAMRKPAPAVATAPTDNAALAAAAPPPMPAITASPVPTNIGDPLATQAAALGADPNEKPGKVTPFGNGIVAHGNVLKIKMDGAVTRIQGASQPSGFTVVIPGRKSLDAAGPLAAKDPRIAAIRVSNEPAGAELTVTFKDGVPNYQVKAHGDTLEMHLAKGGHAGDKDPEAKAPSHGKKHHH